MPLPARLVAHAEQLREAAPHREAGRRRSLNADADLTVADAYAIQLANVDQLIADGRRLLGHKVGLTSKAMQEMLGVDEPDFGVLTDDMYVEDGADVDLATMIAPAHRGRDRPRARSGISRTRRHDARRAGARSGTPSPRSRSSTAASPTGGSSLVDTIADNGSCGALRARRARTPIDGRRSPPRRHGVQQERRVRRVRGRRGGPRASGAVRRVAREQVAEFGVTLREGRGRPARRAAPRGGRRRPATSSWPSTRSSGR